MVLRIDCCSPVFPGLPQSQLPERRPHTHTHTQTHSLTRTQYQHSMIMHRCHRCPAKDSLGYHNPSYNTTPAYANARTHANVRAYAPTPIHAVPRQHYHPRPSMQPLSSQGFPRLPQSQLLERRPQRELLGVPAHFQEPPIKPNQHHHSSGTG